MPMILAVTPWIVAADGQPRRRSRGMHRKAQPRYHLQPAAQASEGLLRTVALLLVLLLTLTTGLVVAGCACDGDDDGGGTGGGCGFTVPDAGR